MFHVEEEEEKKRKEGEIDYIAAAQVNVYINVLFPNIGLNEMVRLICC